MSLSSLHGCITRSRAGSNYPRDGRAQNPDGHRSTLGCLGRGRRIAEHEIYHDDIVCEYPQSREIIHGRRNLQALRTHHPGKPSDFTVRRIVGVGDLWVTEYQINYGGKRAFTVSVMEFRDGKVSHETQYFADPFEAPGWRAQWVAAAPQIRPDTSTT